MEEFQLILDVTLPFVKKLLNDYGEFYPLASGVNNIGNVEQVILEENEENDFPKSTTVIGELKKELHWRQNEFIAIAIFYDVKIKAKNTDAIAVFIEHKNENQAYTFYYPYKNADKEFIFSESWKVLEESLIFTNQL